MGLKDFFTAIKDTIKEVSATRGYPVVVNRCEIEPSQELFSLHGNYQMKIYFDIYSLSIPDGIEFEYMYADINGEVFLEKPFTCSNINFKFDGKLLFTTVPMEREPASLGITPFAQAYPYRVFYETPTPTYWFNSHSREDEKRYREKIETFLRTI